MTFTSNIAKNDFSDVKNDISAFNLLAHHYGEDLAAIQLTLEHDAYVEGEARFMKNLARSVETGEFADSNVAKPVINDLVVKVSARLREWLASIAEAKGRKHIASKTLSTIDADVAALMTVKVLLMKLAGVKNNVLIMQEAAFAIGHSLEEEQRYGRIREQEAAHFKKFVEPALAKRAGKKYKVAYMQSVETHMLEAGELENVWCSWSREEVFHTAVKMIEIVIESTGLVQMVRLNAGNTKDDAETLELSEEFATYFTQRAHVLAGISPVYQPCVVPPKPWKGVSNGGYWAKGRRPIALIRTHTKKALRRYADVSMPAVYQAVNLAQSTAWQVNKKVLNVANEIIKWSSIPVDGVPSVDKLELPEKTEGYDLTEESLKAWKKAASAIYRRERARQSQRLSLEFIIAQANKFSDFESIYFPHNLDWRSRAYAIPMFNPQGNDMTKGLLTFSQTEAKALGDTGAYWLAIHGANTAGFDKASLEERRQWVNDNEEMILSIAANPLDDTRWSDMDAPFCFLAFCFEWSGYVAEGNAYVCSLPIAFDATCSGLQHFSAQLRDEVGGAAVNLRAGGKRQDIYAITAEKVKELVMQDAVSGTDDEVKLIEDKKTGEISEKAVTGTKRLAQQWLAYGITRTVTKRSVMTLAYGSKKFGFADQVATDTVRPSMDKGDSPFTNAGEASRYMAQHIWDAVSVTVVAAVEAMEWLQAAAALLSQEVKEGEEIIKQALPVTWTTPAGFPVWQEYQKWTSKRVRTMFLGTHNLSLTILLDEQKEMDVAKQKAGVAPNFTHSNDASHLQLTVGHANDAYGITAFALVHDSFGTVPADAGNLYKAVRESFHKMYAENDVIGDFYNEFADQLHVSQLDRMPNTPRKGTLNIDEVLDSEFAFS